MSKIQQTNRRARLFSYAAASAMALVATVANAQQAARVFHIQRQPLSVALLQFSKQADIDIVAPADLTRGKSAHAVDGNLAPTVALNQLLEGTGLRVASGSNGGLVLMRADSGPFVKPISDAEEGAAIEEVIVTAQKREQRLADVPMSISAVSSRDIVARGAKTVEDLQYSIPGLALTSFQPGQNQIELRGVSIYSGLPTVGVYLNELPLNTEAGGSDLDIRMLDIERVEVLRGPQGTLYGQGAMGGTIRYITAQPRLDGFEARLGGETSAIQRGGVDWATDGMVNIPVVQDRFAIRVSGAYQNIGGWVDNVTLGDRDANHGASETIRAEALLQATDQFKVSLLVQHQRLHQANLNLSDADDRVESPIPTPITSRADLINLIGTYDFGPVTLLSSTGYMDRHDVTVRDLSALYIPLFETPAPDGLGYAPGTFQSIGDVADATNRVFAQEVRLTSNGHGPLSWTAGGMFRDSKASSHIYTPITPDILPFEFIDVTGTNPSDSRSWAVFGEATYRILPELEATVGGRYFRDRRTQDSISTIFGGTSVDTGRATFDAFSPRFNLLWRASDTLNLYANVAKGFRSGGFNMTSAGLGVVIVPPTYAPDTLWSYEVGGKFNSSDRRVSAELAIYRNEWRDIQSLGFAPGSLVSFTTNGGGMAGWGVDAQVQLRPVPPLTVTVTGGYNNMRYTTTTVEHSAGDRADFVPRYTGSISAEYRLDWTANLPGFVRVDYQLADGFQIFVRNAQTAPASSEVQHYLNARIGLETHDWTASIFARNILDENAITYPAWGSLLTPSRPEPRSGGIALSRSF